MMSETGEVIPAAKESRWYRCVVGPVLSQLISGSSPERIAWTISLGVVLGVFPIMGTTTALCLLVGWMLKLNQPVLHVFKALVYPLHLALILVFIRLGERLYRVPLISFSIPELITKFKEDPIQFGRDFGLAAWHGASAWLLIAPVAMILIKMAVMPMLHKILKRRMEGDL